MLQKKAVLFYALVIVSSTQLLQAQTDNTTSNTTATTSPDELAARKEKYLQGLRKITSDKELRYADSITEAAGIWETDIRFLSSDYQKMYRFDFHKIIDDSNYKWTSDTYVDASSVIRVKVARPATKEEEAKAWEDFKKLVEEKTPQSIEREKIIASQLGKPAPPFSVVDVDSVKYDLAKLKGKVVVLNFWFIGCAPCKREVPELNNLVEKYKSEDVVFLAFEVNDNTASKVKAVARNFRYTQIPSTRKVGDIASKYQIKTYPTSYVIDQDGIVRFGLAAYNPFKLPEMEKTIETLLAKKTAHK